MIWGEVAREPQHVRYETLSAELKRSGVDQSFECWPLENHSLVSQWAEIEKKSYAQLRLGRDEGMRLEDIALEVPRQVSQLGCADALVRENEKWVARNFFHDAAVEIMSQNVRNIDFTGSVLIVGSGCEARVMAFALSQVGFRNMTIAGSDEDEVAGVIKDLRRHCFGVKFTGAQTSSLTQMAATSSVAVNTLASTESKPLLKELSYFNFLKADGIWIETSSDAIGSSLVEEAKDLELQTVSALDVAVHVDAMWAQRCFNVTIDRDRYAKAWGENLR